MRKAFATAAQTISAIFLFAGPANAHAFGQRYDLPLPLWLYTLGAGSAVALSFVIMVLFLRHRRSRPEEFFIEVTNFRTFAWLSKKWATGIAEALSLAIFLVILAACFFGHTDPFENIAPVFVWVIWWVGLAFISALAGNLWDLLNPWSVCFKWFAPLIASNKEPQDYPPRLGYWPAVGLFFVFAWMELISESAENPRHLGTLIVIYSLITWLGMARFGRENWLQHGEVFSVVFGTLARFAPFAGDKGRLRLRFPATGLLVDKPCPFSYVCFVLLLLTSVTFDGILETPAWKSFLKIVSESTFLRGSLIALQATGFDLLKLLKTAALLVLPLVFIAVYLLTSMLIGVAASARFRLAELAGFFILSLIPIAIAYHLSHYLSYLLIAGQNLIPMASDPFGFGWDLFRTSNYRIDIGIVNAKMVWYVAVTAIVLGHIFAVYIAHVMALRIFETTRQALFSQLPMLVLMVGYTMVSLWILSQPIVL